MSLCLWLLCASPSEANRHYSWARCDVDQCPPEGLKTHSLAVRSPDFFPSSEISRSCGFPHKRPWGSLKVNVASSLSLTVYIQLILECRASCIPEVLSAGWGDWAEESLGFYLMSDSTGTMSEQGRRRTDSSEPFLVAFCCFSSASESAR